MFGSVDDVIPKYKKKKCFPIKVEKKTAHNFATFCYVISIFLEI